MLFRIVIVIVNRIFLYHVVQLYCRTGPRTNSMADREEHKASMAPLADGDAPFRSINTAFADGNRGFQAGAITGHVNAEIHHYAPGRSWTGPTSHYGELDR